MRFGVFKNSATRKSTKRSSDTQVLSDDKSPMTENPDQSDHADKVESWTGNFVSVTDAESGAVALVKGAGSSGGHNIYQKTGMIPVSDAAPLCVVVKGNVLKMPDDKPTTIEFVVAGFNVDGDQVGGRRGMNIKKLQISELGPFDFSAVWDLSHNPVHEGDEAIVKWRPALKINANTSGDPELTINTWSIGRIPSDDIFN